MAQKSLQQFALPACGLLLMGLVVQSGLPGRLFVPQAQRDAALVAAVRQGDAEEALRLLNRGANANAQDAKSQYVISLASESTVVATINAISTHGQCVTIQKHRGYAQIMTALVQHRANVNVRNRQKFSPLQQAQSFEEADVVALLQQAGAGE